LVVDTFAVRAAFDLGRLDGVDADDQHRATVQILAIVASRAHRAHALLSHLLA
jgi:hypothetical protein